jgi:hypothetical protein
MDKEAPRVTSEAPSRDPAAVETRLATPWWTAVVGVVLGLLSGFAAARALRPPLPPGDLIDLGAPLAFLALFTVPGGAAFVATAGLARAALRPGRRTGSWLASVLCWSPAVILATSVVSGAVSWLLPGSGPSAPGDLARAPWNAPLWLLLSNLSVMVPVLVGATLGAIAGLCLTRATVDSAR